MGHSDSVSASDNTSLINGPLIYSGLFLTCITVCGITVPEVGVTLIGKQVLIVFSLTSVTTGLEVIFYTRSTEGIMLDFAMISSGTTLLIPPLTTLISEAAGPLQGKAMDQQASAANLGLALASSLTCAFFLVTPAVPFAVGGCDGSRPHSRCTGGKHSVQSVKNRQIPYSPRSFRIVTLFGNSFRPAPVMGKCFTSSLATAATPCTASALNCRATNAF